MMLGDWGFARATKEHVRTRTRELAREWIHTGRSQGSGAGIACPASHTSRSSTEDRVKIDLFQSESESMKQASDGAELEAVDPPLRLQASHVTSDSTGPSDLVVHVQPRQVKLAQGLFVGPETTAVIRRYGHKVPLAYPGVAAKLCAGAADDFSFGVILSAMATGYCVSCNPYR